MTSLISVIMPYYKKKQFVKKSIESVLNQTYSNFEIIIIYDDTDIEDLNYINEIKKIDKRIKIIQNEKNVGAGYSRNIGISKSRGDYIAFLDCDDCWHKEKLFKQLKFMQENKILFSFTSYQIINSNGEIIKYRTAQKKIEFNDLLKDCNIGLSTVMLKKYIINEKCKFPNLKTKEDLVLWLKLSKNIHLYGIDIPLMQWRKLNDSLSSSIFQKLKDGFSVYKNFLGFNSLKSLFYLIILSINYLKKN